MKARALAVSFVFLLGMLTPNVLRSEDMQDSFETLDGWTTNASDGATVSITPEPGVNGMAMRVDFDLPKDGGWVIVRKNFEVTLPENYAFSFQLRGQAPQENFEFKLVDPSGKSVWWRKRQDFTFPTDWQLVTIRKARIVLAWGGPPVPKKIGAIEFAVNTGNGGKGTFWLDDLKFEEREPASEYRRSAKVTASASAAEHDPAAALDLDPKTSWRSGPGESQWLLIDLLRERDFGGLIIDWDSVDFAAEYTVEVSDDAQKWTTAFNASSGRGGRDFVYMPDAESRYVRLSLAKSSRGQGYGIVNVSIQPLEFSDTPNRFFQAVAAESPPGSYPKYLYDKQTYWTIVGVDGGEKTALLNEEGQLEIEKGSFSIEPFLYVDGKLLSWSGVQTRQELDQGYLPIPSVVWEGPNVSLRVTAFAAGEPTSSTPYATYKVENRGPAHARIQLFLALRPFQVNPIWQSLNMVGGVAPIHDIRFDGGAVWVNRDKVLVPLRPPDGFGATSLEQGALVDALREGRVPPHPGMVDRFGFGSAAMVYAMELDPGQSGDAAIAVPSERGDAISLPPPADVTDAGARLEDVRRTWQAKLGHVEFDLPPDGRRLIETWKSTLAYILINRDGPRLQPGARNYARSWIRDGAMTSAALLSAGFTSEPRQFLEWFVRYQGADGKIPCCVDRRGPDPVNEHDSNGEFLYAIAEIYRFTRDVGLVSELWPNAVKAVDYLDGLRRKRTTEAYQSGENRLFYGLLPASISHEGYASKPMHSYWDDFFALRGFKDATQLATAMGDGDKATRYAALRDTFRTDLHASIARAMEEKKIDFIPGAADLGDFDPTSTAIAIDPAGEADALPQKALRRTFDKYWENLESRRDPKSDWDNFAPYEIRNVAPLIELGERGRAMDLLREMLAYQRPKPWNEWQEIVWRDASAASFIGDMPHTWVASGFVRALRTLFVYERENDHALVVGAGVPAEWVAEGKSIGVKRLPTHFGTLGYRMEGRAGGTIALQLQGDFRMPPGNVVVRPPLPRPIRAVRVNGRPIETFSNEEVMVSEVPCDIEIDPEPATDGTTPTAAPLPSPEGR